MADTDVVVTVVLWRRSSADGFPDGIHTRDPHRNGLRPVAAVRLRASQINGCGWCVDMHTKKAMAAGESMVRLNLVAAWRESTVFTEAEQAALELAEEGTRLADAHDGVTDETWARVAKHYDDDQIAALVCLVALINAANRLAVIVHQKGGSYQAGMFAAAVS